jgi:hypothetical protein
MVVIVVVVVWSRAKWPVFAKPEQASFLVRVSSVSGPLHFPAFTLINMRALSRSAIGHWLVILIVQHLTLHHALTLTSAL